jgi:hypothetical protein
VRIACRGDGLDCDHCQLAGYLPLPLLAVKTGNIDSSRIELTGATSLDKRGPSPQWRGVEPPPVDGQAAGNGRPWLWPETRTHPIMARHRSEKTHRSLLAYVCKSSEQVNGFGLSVARLNPLTTHSWLLILDVPPGVSHSISVTQRS